MPGIVAILACYVELVALSTPHLISRKISGVLRASKKGDTQVLSHASTPQLFEHVNACVFFCFFCQVEPFRGICTLHEYAS